MPQRTPEEQEEVERLYQGFGIRLFELNLYSRMMSLLGFTVELDVIERTDPVSGNRYSEVVEDRMPEDLCADDTLGTGTSSPPPA
jgi:hypothetical protein